MPIDLRQLGSKCRRIRDEILGITLEDAAERTGIEPHRLDAIEGGRDEPTGDEVLILADVYGEPVDYFITSERSASIEKASDLYRMYGDSFSPQDRQNIQEFLRLCRMEDEIESLLGARPRVFDFQPGPTNSYLKIHGRLTAEKLRRDMGMGDRPLDNPFGLGRTLGCHVFRRALHNSSVSGLTLHHDSFGPCILVNYIEDTYRQNFSVVHELCHALLDNDCNVTVTFQRESDEKVLDRQRREWRANSFAAHLLFPQGVRERMALGRTREEHVASILREAANFKVNPVVVLFALREASRLTQEQVEGYKALIRIPRDQKDDSDLAGEPSRIRERRASHLAVGLSPEYVSTCLRACREGQISFGKLADALLVSPFELPALLADLGHFLDLGDGPT